VQFQQQICRFVDLVISLFIEHLLCAKHGVRRQRKREWDAVAVLPFHVFIPSAWRGDQHIWHSVMKEAVA